MNQNNTTQEEKRLKRASATMILPCSSLALILTDSGYPLGVE
jgi:hypothetical protein